jgi:endo-1,4-beta-xylanase
MHSPSKPALRVAAGVVSMLLLGCGRSTPAPGHDAATMAGTGGDIVVVVGTGGAQPATGGGAGSEVTSTGGAPGTGGRSVGAGGTASLGGATATSSSFGHGGAFGHGGTTGPGGSPGTGGRTGAGGATAAGGANGRGGATGYPRKFVGNIDTRGSIRTDFVTYWDQFTPENAGKWASVQGSSASVYNWKSLDAMYKYCEDNDIAFKEHTFIWGSAQPNWLVSLDTTTGPTVVQTWMKAFCDRFPNTRLIDVVNEPPPHTTPPFANAIGGGTNTTWDWIANSFKWAREACPNAILILNDYNNLEYESYVQHTIDIVNAIKMLGAPIDAVGCQTHEAKTLPASTLKANIDLIASSTGLPVYITEYDIGLADDEQQRAQYADHFPMFMSNPNVKGVTIWGYIVGATWRSNTGIMSSDGAMRPAMTWLMDFLER